MEEKVRAERGAAAFPETTRQVLRVVDLLGTWMAFISGALFLLTSFFITADVIGRKFFHISSAVTDEIGGYALAMGGMWALAYTLRTGGHVRIDILLPHLPRGVRSVLDYGALIAMLLVACMLAFYSWRLTLDSLAIDARAMSFIRTPLFLPQGLMAFGFTVLTLDAITILVVGLTESLRLGRLAPLEGLEASDVSEKA